MVLRLVPGVFVLACGASSSPAGDTSIAETSAASSSAVSSSAVSSSEVSSSDASADSSSGEASSSESSTVTPLVLVATRLTVPAGTVVEEFEYEAEGIAPDAPTIGRTIVVAVRDVSHPDRDHDVLCPGNHPLDGCATVDYGAFGYPHDNHVIVDGSDGPLELHLHKSREVLPIMEPLPVTE